MAMDGPESCYHVAMWAHTIWTSLTLVALATPEAHVMGKA